MIAGICSLRALFRWVTLEMCLVGRGSTVYSSSSTSTPVSPKIPQADALRLYENLYSLCRQGIAAIPADSSCSPCKGPYCYSNAYCFYMVGGICHPDFDGGGNDGNDVGRNIWPNPS